MTSNSNEKNANHDNKWLLFVVIVVIVVAGVLGFYLINRVIRPVDSLADACVQVLPQDQRVGIKIETRSDRSTAIDLAGRKGVEKGATPEQIAAFVRCLESTKHLQVTIE